MTSRSTLWFFNIAMENRPIFKFGKTSISIRAIVITMANCECHNQMLTSINFTFFGDINRCLRRFDHEIQHLLVGGLEHGFYFP